MSADPLGTLQSDRASATAPGAAFAASPTLIRWLASGERGLSSDTMIMHLIGLDTGRTRWRKFGVAHPHDPDDLTRCRRLIEEVPPIGLLFPCMASASPVWAALVGAWDALCKTMDEEAPEWRDGHGSAPRTYALMQTLIDGAKPSPRSAKAR